MIRQKCVNAVDVLDFNDEAAVLVPAISGGEEPIKPAVPRRGGPRTPTGKQRSRYNALRNGFFAKEAVIVSPFFSESKKEFREILRELVRERQPEGITEMTLVEFVATQYLKLRRLRRVEQALILERHTPTVGNPKPQPYNPSVGNETQTLLQKELGRIEKMRRSLPTFDDLEWLHCCESHILRELYRALSELERRQKQRRGNRDPEKLN
jgi:hypothetical protein